MNSSQQVVSLLNVSDSQVSSHAGSDRSVRHAVGQSESPNFKYVLLLFSRTRSLVIETAEQRCPSLDPVLHRFVRRQQNGDDEVGRVARRAQRALALARLVDGTRVANTLRLDVHHLHRSQPENGHRVVQDLLTLLRQDASAGETEKMVSSCSPEIRISVVVSRSGDTFLQKDRALRH